MNFEQTCFKLNEQQLHLAWKLDAVVSLRPIALATCNDEWILMAGERNHKTVATIRLAKEAV